MDIGIGLPTTLTLDGPTVVEWARRAEERGFASLGTIDRLVYPNYDTITALAAAAGATSRDRAVHRHPAGADLPAGLAGQGHRQLARAIRRPAHARPRGRRPGRGLRRRRAPVRRPWPADGRGLELLHRAWVGEPIAGGRFPVTRRCRAARYGPGRWQRPRRDPPYGPVGGRLDGRRCLRGAGRRVRRKGRRGLAGAGREGEPRLAALMYFGLGDDEALAHSLRTYYGWLGETAEYIVQAAARTPEQITERIRPFTTPASRTSCSTRRSRP